MPRASLIDIGRSLLALLLALLLSAPAAAQGANHIAAQLVAAGPVEPGETLDVAFVFTPDDGWHGYWSNPGDAGYGMSLDWHLPDGWVAGEPRYPVPERLVIGGLMNHVFEGEYAVIVPIRVPVQAAVGNFVPITVDAQWLACTDRICVPENAQLALRIPSDDDPRFARWRAALPPLLDSTARLQFTAERLRLAIPLPASLPLADPHVFVSENGFVDYAAPQEFTRQGNLLVAEIARGGLRQQGDAVSGIIAFGSNTQAGRDGLRFVAEPGTVPMGGEPLAGRAQTGGLGWLVLAALAGGLLLNLMPCVFPILSVKALTLARAGESDSQARREALAYTAGVVLACLALGGLLLILRAGGEQVGWAFQLQEPLVVVALLVLAVLVTANLGGVFALPSLSVTRAGGRSSAFATGLLAAFVATPCTGPFMAAALGAALLLPWVQALLLFGALGLGLALPFLLLGFLPAARRLLPRPGAWMERFRKAMAVPMGLTALALVWLTARLGGQGFALVALILVAGIAIAAMVVGRLQRHGKMAWPAFALIAVPFLLFGAFALPASREEGAAAVQESLLDPVPFDEFVLMDTVQSQGRPVFLWFTADWCLTCKVNENVAIEREAVRDAFEKAGVVAMRGDWTRRDAAISQFLDKQGAAGVPLYLWYPVDGAPRQLPQVLTPDMLKELAQGG